MTEIRPSLAGANMPPFKPLDTDAELRAVSEELEAAFLTEMLKHAGVGDVSDSFGGGAGEEHFASFLREAQAKEMVKAGGIGLAQTLFEALKETQNEQ